MKSEIGEFAIAVLAGGVSGEREVSKRSAAALHSALRQFYPVELIEVNAEAIPDQLDPARHLIVSALHGVFGEDGGMQQLLDEAGFIYAGSDAASSRLCMDKTAAKEMVEKSGVRTSPGIAFEAAELPEAEEIVELLGGKLVLKPNNEGSSIGLHFIDGIEELQEKLQSLPFGKWLVEKQISGRELTVGILDGKALGIVEILPRSGRFDYQSKYTSGLTDYRWPADLSNRQSDEIRKMAEIAFQSCGCRDFARVDFMLSESGEIRFLEINTLPGLTETSLLPKSADCEDIDFQMLAKRIVEPAMKRFAELQTIK